MKLKDTTNIWIAIGKAAEVLGLSVQTVKKQCRKGSFVFKIVKRGKKSHYFIHLKSLPDFAQDKYLGEHIFDKKYSEAPNWAKEQAEKYLPILKASNSLKGEALKDFINKWNNENTEELHTSYSSLIKMRRRFFRYGISGLLSKHGQHLTGSTVPDDYFEYFKNLYLVEGAPSLRTCWDLTLGYAIRMFDAKRETFPSFMAFKRRLDKEIPKQSIYLARMGETAWNRKYGGYIERDYSNITCNEVWVSDHAQIDVACFYSDDKVVFPWVTVWRDYKSGKWLGWILQSGNPNSDHIFQSFYYAAEKYGLPKEVIIDNGKDYRSKDFAGGRKTIKIAANKSKTMSMLAELNIDVHFALPYNAQTKPIERDFLKIKELLSKHCVGYRGGNVVERPEKLAKEIKSGKIMRFEDFKQLFDNYILNVLNKRPSQGTNLKGLCPDELFYSEFKEKITTTKGALKLFCMRTSKDFTIRRNGIKDTALGITYWADWMISKMGLRVYLRRDIEDYKEAWVFRCDNDEFIGTVNAVKAVAALHANKVSKEEFKEAMSIKKRNFKTTKSYTKNTMEISPQEKYENYKAAYNSIEKDFKADVKISKIANTNMDKAVRKKKEQKTSANIDLSIFLKKENEQEQEFYLFETDKILAQEALQQNKKIRGSL